MKLTAVLLLAYFLAILISLRMPRRDVQSRHLHFLRAFFPNWRFYHAVGHRPTLELRVQLDAAEWSDWTPYFPRAERHARQFVHNPDINLQLVEQTLVEHLAGDLAEMSDEENVTDLVSYRLTVRLALKCAMQNAMTLANGLHTGPAFDTPRDAGQLSAFQFRVRLLHPLEPDGDNPTVLVSPILQARPDLQPTGVEST
ncbi:MAG: hypothetical protein EBT08_18890 [Betaproteobacteria bacterium]|nr:hypothetical protein [Betaproteobacteria bacterium]